MSTTAERRYSIGKVDYNGSGRKNCRVVITWTLQDGRFSMCGEVWNPRDTDIYSGGQNLEEIAKLFPHNRKVQEMVAIWRRWHLNDMVPGSPAQMAHLDAATYPGHGRSHYDWALETLTSAGLHPDPSYKHNGEPYRYGAAWLKKDLPADVIAQIESW